MLEAVLRSALPHHWIQIVVEKYSSTIEILDSKILPANLVEHLFDIQVKPRLADEVIETLRKDRDVEELEVMKSESGHVFGAATLSSCSVCREVA